jgi:hypothetical protein
LNEFRVASALADERNYRKIHKGQQTHDKKYKGEASRIYAVLALKDLTAVELMIPEYLSDKAQHLILEGL